MSSSSSKRSARKSKTEERAREPQTLKDGTQPTLSTEQLERLKKHATKARQLHACLGQIVTLLLRSPTDRQRALQDLEWLVLPALNAGQFVIAEAHAKDTGRVSPIGAVLWASVSADVDGYLTATLDRPVTLKPEDWKSGDIPWVMATVGEPKVVDGLLQQLARSIFKDRPAKMRRRGPDGKAVIAQLGPSTQP